MNPASPSPGPVAQATPTPSPSADPERLKRLSEELRCLVCQNQTLADSNAELAVDLKRQIETLLKQGQSDSQIRDYMVARYGDFVLYRPPLQRTTWVLWFGPFGMLAGGAALWWLIQRRNRLQRDSAAPRATHEGAAASNPAGTASHPSSADSLARARALLNR
jgi:cytochrome c-type biogenesis protein CcmH